MLIDINGCEVTSVQLPHPFFRLTYRGLYFYLVDSLLRAVLCPLRSDELEEHWVIGALSDRSDKMVEESTRWEDFTSELRFK